MPIAPYPKQTKVDQARSATRSAFNARLHAGSFLAGVVTALVSFLLAR